MFEIILIMKIAFGSAMFIIGITMVLAGSYILLNLVYEHFKRKRDIRLWGKRYK